MDIKLTDHEKRMIENPTPEILKKQIEHLLDIIWRQKNVLKSTLENWRVLEITTPKENVIDRYMITQNIEMLEKILEKKD